MPAREVDFGTVRDIALSLPGVTEGSLHGAPSLKLAGRIFACPAIHESAESDSLVLRLEIDQRAKLIATNPDVYYVTDHYLKHQIVLVRMAKISRKQLGDLLRSAWLAASPNPAKKKRA